MKKISILKLLLLFVIFSINTFAEFPSPDTGLLEAGYKLETFKKVYEEKTKLQSQNIEANKTIKNLRNEIIAKNKVLEKLDNKVKNEKTTNKQMQKSKIDFNLQIANLKKENIKLKDNLNKAIEISNAKKSSVFSEVLIILFIGGIVLVMIVIVYKVKFNKLEMEKKFNAYKTEIHNLYQTKQEMFERNITTEYNSKLKEAVEVEIAKYNAKLATEIDKVRKVHTSILENELNEKKQELEDIHNKKIKDIENIINNKNELQDNYNKLLKDYKKEQQINTENRGKFESSSLIEKENKGLKVEISKLLDILEIVKTNIAPIDNELYEEARVIKEAVNNIPKFR